VYESGSHPGRRYRNLQPNSTPRRSLHHWHWWTLTVNWLYPIEAWSDRIDSRALHNFVALAVRLVDDMLSQPGRPRLVEAAIGLIPDHPTVVQVRISPKGDKELDERVAALETSLRSLRLSPIRKGPIALSIRDHVNDGIPDETFGSEPFVELISDRCCDSLGCRL
jgi:hypothetical protein